jgi:flagellar motor switch protein FliM
MSQEKMTQDEIDALLNNLKIGEFEDPTTKLNESSLNPEQVKYKYNAIVCCYINLSASSDFFYFCL